MVVPFSLAILSKTSYARWVCPLAMKKRALSGIHRQAMSKTSRGSDDNPRSHLQPRVGMTKSARSTSKHEPRAQKTSVRTKHLARCFEGRNSEYSVTLKQHQRTGTHFNKKKTTRKHQILFYRLFTFSVPYLLLHVITYHHLFFPFYSLLNFEKISKNFKK